MRHCVFPGNYTLAWHVGQFMRSSFAERRPLTVLDVIQEKSSMDRMSWFPLVTSIFTPILLAECLVGLAARVEIYYVNIIFA